MAKPTHTLVVDTAGKYHVVVRDTVKFLETKGTSKFKCNQMKEELNG